VVSAKLVVNDKDGSAVSVSHGMVVLLRPHYIDQVQFAVVCLQQHLLATLIQPRLFDLSVQQSTRSQVVCKEQVHVWNEQGWVEVGEEGGRHELRTSGKGRNRQAGKHLESLVRGRTFGVVEN